MALMTKLQLWASVSRQLVFQRYTQGVVPRCGIQHLIFRRFSE